MAFETAQNSDSKWDLLRKMVGNQVAQGASSGGSGSALVQAGSQAVANNADSASVVFPQAFATVPIVQATLSRPNGDPIVSVAVDTASVTVNGFNVQFGAAVGNANYVLDWRASA